MQQHSKIEILGNIYLSPQRSTIVNCDGSYEKMCKQRIKNKRKRLIIIKEKIACSGGLTAPVRIRMPVNSGGNLKSNFLRTLCFS